MQTEICNIVHKLDSITYNHSIRVMCIAREIEDYYNLTTSLVSNAALVHDIGKTYISSKILDKKECLDLIERELINLHPYIGYKMLKQMNVNEDICRIVLYHHGVHPVLLEKVEPYQNPLINDMALMLHTIDSFEALTSDRPYHRGLLATEALEVMIKESGHHQAVLDYLIHMLDNEKMHENSAVYRHGYTIEPHIIENVLDNICKVNFKIVKPALENAI